MGLLTEGLTRRGEVSRMRGRLARLFSPKAPMMQGVAITAMLLGGMQVAAQSQPAAQNVDAFRQQAEQLGVQRCANLFSTAGAMTTAGSTYAVQVQASGESPDAHAVQGVAGISYDTPELRGSAAGVVLAAPVGQSCEGQLVRVAPFQKACAEVLGLLPAGSTPAGNLMDVPLYNLGGNQGQAMLVSSGNSCVVVTVAPLSGA